MNILPGDLRFGAGQPIKRLEDQRLLTGKGQFIDDKPEDGALWLHLLRSPHAHARIVSIDGKAASEVKGVEAVYTGADLIADDIGTLPTLLVFQRPDGSPMTAPPRRLLAHEVVRFAGEPVAAVVATSRVAAQTAAEAIAVEYQVLPSVIDPAEAIKPGAPAVWAEVPDNIVAAMSYGDAAAVEAAFAKAAHVVSLDLVSQRLVPSAMEPRSTIAEVEKKSGRLTLYVQSQTPGSTRDLLAEAVLKRPKESVRVLVGDIGGGFGQKTSLYPEDGIVAYAAVKLGRKMRWRGDRTDEFVGGTHGRDLTSTGEFALDAKGRVQAYRVRSLGGTGAYISGAGTIIPLVLGPFVQSGVYDLPLVHYEVKAVMTNTAPVGAYRGAGRPEGVFIVERLMDAAARQIGMDPRAIRKVNYIKPAQLPYTNAVGQVYDSGAFAHMLERATELADWDGFAARKKAAKKKGLLYGRGLTSYIEWTGGRAHTEKVSLHATAEGRIILHSGTQAMGQGLQTTYSQMVAASLGIPIDKIDVVQGDTDLATGFRQRRLAFAVRRRHRGGGVDQRSDRESPREGLEPARSFRRGHRISRRLADGGRHRQADRPVRYREKGKWRAPERGQRGRSRRPELAERHPYLRSRDRSGDRRQPGGALHHGRRRRRRGQSDAGDRTGSRRRRAGHRTGAV